MLYPWLRLVIIIFKFLQGKHILKFEEEIVFISSLTQAKRTRLGE